MAGRRSVLRHALIIDIFMGFFSPGDSYCVFTAAASASMFPGKYETFWKGDLPTASRAHAPA